MTAASDYAAWGIARFAGAAPPRPFLPAPIFPLGAFSLLATSDDTDRSLLALDLALKVAVPAPAAMAESCSALGGAVSVHGAAVIFTADDRDEVHRRLHRIDPDNRRARGDRLWVVPLPNASGAPWFVSAGKDGLAASESFLAVREQLLAIPDLKLVVFDPLSLFLRGGGTTGTAADTFAAGLLARLAAETGAAVIGTVGGDPLWRRTFATADAALDALQHACPLHDSARALYAVWAPLVEEQAATLRRLQQPFRHDAVYYGAVLKGTSQHSQRTFVRNALGVLGDGGERLAVAAAAR